MPQVRVRSLDANLGPSRYREFTRLTTKAEVIGYVQKKKRELCSSRKIMLCLKVMA